MTDKAKEAPKEHKKPSKEAEEQAAKAREHNEG